MGALVLVKGLVRELEGGSDSFRLCRRLRRRLGMRAPRSWVVWCATFLHLGGGVACVGAAFDGELEGLRVGAYVEVFIVVWAVGFICGASIGARSD